MGKARIQLNSGNHESLSDYAIGLLQRHFQNGIPEPATALSELYPDSLELIETLFELEQNTGKTLSNVELSTLSTLGDLIQFFSAPAKEQE